MKGVKSRSLGTLMSGEGLKQKYRSYADDTRYKGRAIKGKK